MPWMNVSKDWERKRREIVERHDVSDAELHSLRVYNQECARGLMHTPEWEWRMAGIQDRVDARKLEIDEAFSEMHSAKA